MSTKSDQSGGELRPEYQFDYSQAKPNRFAKGLEKGGRLVVLQPDVAAAFADEAAVNDALREYLRSHGAPANPA